MIQVDEHEDLQLLIPNEYPHQAQSGTYTGLCWISIESTDTMHRSR